MAACGAHFHFRHRFISSFLKNVLINKSQHLHLTCASNRTFSQTTKIDGIPRPVTRGVRFPSVTDQSTLGCVHNACALHRPSQTGLFQHSCDRLPRFSGSGRTLFSTLATTQPCGGFSSPFLKKYWGSIMCNRMLNLSSAAGSSAGIGSGSQTSLRSPSGHNAAKSDDGKITMNPAWHGVRLSNENGYLSYNRNSYLCLVIGATMNVQTIIPHSAEAAVAFFILGALNVIFGTGGFIINLKQMRQDFGMSRLAYFTHISWSIIHLVFYFLIAFFYLQGLDDDETLEHVGGTIQSRKMLELDDDDDDNDNDDDNDE